jgi:mRNA-degrading endonuclease RelE of RelBE toxin-antitoxin system
MSSPPAYEVRLTSAATHELRRLEKPTRQRVDEALRHEAVRVGDAHAGRGGKGVKLMRSMHERVYRLRVGTWRVLYELDHDRHVLRVDAVVARPDLERWLRDR